MLSSGDTLILPILRYGSPVLRQKAGEVTPEDHPAELARTLLLTLKNAGGIGLAGPQVGLLKNIFIMDTTPMKGEGIPVTEKAFFNPRILHYGDEEVFYTEGCLSIPGIHEEVERPRRIEVRYQDENLDWHQEELDHLIARIFLHEYDHLQGILFIDRLGALRKKLMKSKLRKIMIL